MFYVGQKVVCVVEGVWEPTCGEETPRKGEVYTVRDVKQVWDKTGLRLVEVVNAPRRYDLGFAECMFLSEHFRPLVDKKTDISIFQEIARHPKTPAHDDRQPEEVV